ncbi:MAG: hypothetical protein EBR82_47955 [Caulobacteraceae bacterium]|nr:hypothetical protein [Caulobacteraceae bacterium]
MRIKRVTEACLYESGAGTISDKAGEVTLIAIACANEDMKVWRANIKRQYRTRHPKCGSIFLIFVLPLLISLISTWLSRWIFKESDLQTLKAEALNELG